MDLLLVYDVATGTAAGEARLRRVARICEGYGTRVQKSVFELIVDEEHLPPLERDLEGVIDFSDDSVRIYRLSVQHPIRVMGRSGPLDSTRGPLVL
jgi:CRISPR-associated protein Cas2